MLMQVQSAIRLAAPWAALYNDHPLVQGAVLFAHLSGIMVGGGAAVTADREALRVRRADEEARQHYLRHLRLVHRAVLGALAVILVSGVLQVAADIETFVVSPIFWVKMALVFLLALNGWFLIRTGRKVEEGQVAAERGWNRLVAISVLSLSLWLLIILAGAVLVSVG
jgi:uncharacterized membrane protein